MNLHKHGIKEYEARVHRITEWLQKDFLSKINIVELSYLIFEENNYMTR